MSEIGRDWYACAPLTKDTLFPEKTQAPTPQNHKFGYSTGTSWLFEPSIPFAADWLWSKRKGPAFRSK